MQFINTITPYTITWVYPYNLQMPNFMQLLEVITNWPTALYNVQSIGPDVEVSLHVVQFGG